MLYSNPQRFDAPGTARQPRELREMADLAQVIMGIFDSAGIGYCLPNSRAEATLNDNSRIVYSGKLPSFCDKNG